MIAYFNDGFLPEEKTFLQAKDLSILRGYGVFDFFRIHKGSPLFFDDYLERFFHSAKELHLSVTHTKEELREVILELSRRNGLGESCIRMVLTGGYSPDGYTPATPNLLLLQQGLELPSEAGFRAGIKVMTYEYLRELPLVKSTNYMMGVWLQEEMRERGVSDVLYYKDGWVSEFPRANVFIVTKEGRVVTPAKNILKGITRMKVLELARERYEVEERPVQLEEVKGAAEVFMTSTTKRVMPVVEVDGVKIGEGKAGAVSKELWQRFLGLEDRMGGVVVSS